MMSLDDESFSASPLSMCARPFPGLQTEGGGFVQAVERTRREAANVVYVNTVKWRVSSIPPRSAAIEG